MFRKHVRRMLIISIAITFLITIQIAVTHIQEERSRADVNQDGIVNILDLVIVAKYLGQPEAEVEKEPILPAVPAEEIQSPDDFVIDFTPKPPPKPELPTGIDIDPDKDRVFYPKELFPESSVDGLFSPKYVYDDANSAAKNGSVKSFFTESEKWIAEFCGAPESPLSPDLSLFFSNRQARNDFLGGLSGGYHVETDAGLDIPESSIGVSIWESTDWWFAIGWVNVVDGKAYYGLNLSLNTSHPDCTP